jgi:hypothetical protein
VLSVSNSRVEVADAHVQRLVSVVKMATVHNVYYTNEDHNIFQRPVALFCPFVVLFYIATVNNIN